MVSHDLAELKKSAFSLSEQLSAFDLKLSSKQCLEVLSRMRGFATYDALLHSPSLPHEPATTSDPLSRSESLIACDLGMLLRDEFSLCGHSAAPSVMEWSMYRSDLNFERVDDQDAAALSAGTQTFACYIDACTEETSGYFTSAQFDTLSLRRTYPIRAASVGRAFNVRLPMGPVFADMSVPQVQAYVREYGREWAARVHDALADQVYALQVAEQQVRTAVWDRYLVDDLVVVGFNPLSDDFVPRGPSAYAAGHFVFVSPECTIYGVGRGRRRLRGVYSIEAGLLLNHFVGETPEEEALAYLAARGTDVISIDPADLIRPSKRVGGVR